MGSWSSRSRHISKVPDCRDDFEPLFRHCGFNGTIPMREDDTKDPVQLKINAAMMGSRFGRERRFEDACSLNPSDSNRLEEYLQARRTCRNKPGFGTRYDFFKYEVSPDTTKRETEEEKYERLLGPKRFAGTIKFTRHIPEKRNMETMANEVAELKKQIIKLLKEDEGKIIDSDKETAWSTYYMPLILLLQRVHSNNHGKISFIYKIDSYPVNVSYDLSYPEATKLLQQLTNILNDIKDQGSLWTSP